MNTSARKKIQALQRLAGSPNPHEATLAASRAAELMQKHGVTAADLTTPQNWAEMSDQQKAKFNGRFMAEISRALIRMNRRHGTLSKEDAAAQLRKLAEVPAFTDHDRILYSTQGGRTPIDEVRRIVHDEIRIMDATAGGVNSRDLGVRVCAKLPKQDHKRARAIIAGIISSWYRQSGIRSRRRRRENW